MILYINVLLFFFGQKSESKDHKFKSFDGLREESKIGSGEREGRNCGGSGEGVPGPEVVRLVAAPADGPVVPGVVLAVSPLPAVVPPGVPPLPAVPPGAPPVPAGAPPGPDGAGEGAKTPPIRGEVPVPDGGGPGLLPVCLTREAWDPLLGLPAVVSPASFFLLAS